MNISTARKLINEALATGEIDADGDELLPDFVVSNDPPVFFKQMEEDEFKNYDIEYPKLSHDHDPVIDYCYGMQYAIIYHSEHRQTGLTLDDCAGKIIDERFPTLHEYANPDNPINRYHWCTVNVRGYENKPHTIAVLRQLTSDREEYIPRSELIVLLQYMRCKMQIADYAHNQIVPVLLISIRAQFLRVIECYHDGEKVHIQYGLPVHINADLPREEQQSRLDYILRWFASTPQGETKDFSPLKPTDRRPLPAKSGNLPTSSGQQFTAPSGKGEDNKPSPQK